MASLPEDASREANKRKENAEDADFCDKDGEEKPAVTLSDQKCPNITSGGRQHSPDTSQAVQSQMNSLTPPSPQHTAPVTINPYPLSTLVHTNRHQVQEVSMASNSIPHPASVIIHPPSPAMLTPTHPRSVSIRWARQQSNEPSLPLIEVHWL